MARASSLLWSYPGNGAAGVPTDVDYWPVLVGKKWIAPSLGDVELEPNERGGFDLGKLTPNTSYTIQHADGESVVHEVTFTTGDGPGQGTARVPKLVAAKQGNWGDASEFCRSALAASVADDCFDMGDPLWTQFQTDQQPIIGWIVQTTSDRPYAVLPAACGPGALGGLESTCVRLAALTEQGVSDFTTRRCADQLGDAGTTRDSAPEEERGCSFAARARSFGGMPARSSLVTSLALAVAFLGCRRLRRVL